MIEVAELCALVEDCIVWADGETPTRIEPDTPLLASGLLDSLTVLRIVKRLEESVGVTLPPSMLSARNFRTPQHLHTAVTAAASQPAP
jgi:acyl carrier protein